MESQRLPGFTAEKSLQKTDEHYISYGHTVIEQSRITQHARGIGGLGYACNGDVCACDDSAVPGDCDDLKKNVDWNTCTCWDDTHQCICFLI